MANDPNKFKSSNSWVIQIPKKDKEKLHDDNKVKKIDQEIFNYIDKQYDKHKGLMDRLKNI